MEFLSKTIIIPTLQSTQSTLYSNSPQQNQTYGSNENPVHITSEKPPQLPLIRSSSMPELRDIRLISRELEAASIERPNSSSSLFDHSVKPNETYTPEDTQLKVYLDDNLHRKINHPEELFFFFECLSIAVHENDSQPVQYLTSESQELLKAALLVLKEKPLAIQVWYILHLTLQLQIYTHLVNRKIKEMLYIHGLWLSTQLEAAARKEFLDQLIPYFSAVFQGEDFYSKIWISITTFSFQTRQYIIEYTHIPELLNILMRHYTTPDLLTVMLENIVEFGHYATPIDVTKIYTNTFLLLDEWSSQSILMQGKYFYFYRILRNLLTLSESQHIILPLELINLINAVYSQYTKIDRPLWDLLTRLNASQQALSDNALRAVRLGNLAPST